MTPSSSSRTSSATCARAVARERRAPRRARTGRADHRHDDHAGRGLLPIGIQGGLTGSLFREFAFTLAGAVAISGVVALTLSPVMSAKFLRAGEKNGFRRTGESRFRSPARLVRPPLDATLRVRPAVYTAWIGLTILAAIMFFIMAMSAKELAPTEDQGVIFGIVNASANATIEQTPSFADAAGKVFQSFPQTDFTFQITFPNNGFGGMVLKPWDQRKETAFEIAAGAGKTRHDSRDSRCFPSCRLPCPAAGIPGRDSSCSRPKSRSACWNLPSNLQAKGDGEQELLFPADHRHQDRPAAGRSRDRPRQGRRARFELAARRRGLSAMFGGNFVNRFNIAGRSYKVIPQIETRGPSESRTN